jgi:glycosyltransferase involved in cell wall biosynthesis
MMNKNSIRASIIIPMYNSEKNIAEALKALERQTEKRFEVIIIDDGSTDNSFKIARRLKKEFSFRLKIEKQKNAGPAAARNKGAKKASAEILIFLDSDCVAKNAFVEEILKIFNDDSISGVQGEYETKNKQSLIARYAGYEIKFRHEKMKGKFIDHIATYACAYRKKDFDHGFKESFKKANMEDTELSYRLADSNKKLVFQPKAIVKHNHPESFVKFLKQQFTRGYWRALGHIEHKKKLLEDSYMGKSMAVQGIISSLFFLSIFEACILSLLRMMWQWLIPIFFLFIIYISNINLGFYCFRFERKMLIIAPFIATLRSISGTAGFLIGICKIFISKKNLSIENEKRKIKK